MKKFLQKYGVTEEQLASILEAYQKDHPDAKDLPEYIGKSRFDEVNAKLKESESKVTSLTKQIEDLNKASESSIAEAVKKATDELTANYKSEMDTMKKDYEMENAILKAHGKNSKAIKALIDPSKDLNEEIERLQKDEAYLFESEIPGGTGKNGDNGGSSITDDEMKQMRDAVGVY